MQLNPHLAFNGQCEAAFKFYETCLGGKIVFMMTYGDSPMAEQMPADWSKKIIHATLALGDQRLTGADEPPEWYKVGISGCSTYGIFSLGSHSPAARASSTQPYAGTQRVATPRAARRRPVQGHGSAGQRDVTVIVSDMSDIDAQPMKNGSASPARVDERLVGMQKG